MEIKGFLRTSMLDWEGKIVATIFVPGCNFRCPFCQNVDLVLTPGKLETVAEAGIFRYLNSKKGWIDGICLTGGEPCAHPDLPDFLRRIRDLEMLIKLDTNGSVPEMLEKLLAQNLVDYLAMDVKAAFEPEALGRAVGINAEEVLEKLKRSVRIIKGCGVGYEFRTTVVPTLHTEEDVKEIASFLRGAKRYVLQNFSNKATIDPGFGKIAPYPRETLERMRSAAAVFIDEAVLRGV